MDWHTYYMGIARNAALKSKDSTQVGAVLVDPDGAVILTAFNGPPRGVRDLPERFERPVKYMFASHAEANLVAFAARRGIMTKGCKVYCTHLSCASCTRSLIQAGVIELVYGDGTFQALAAEKPHVEMMCYEAGVHLEQFSG